MSLIKCFDDEAVWQSFLSYKSAGNRLTEAEKKYFSEYVGEKKYKAVSYAASRGEYIFGLPEKKLINKSESAKKRAVYTYGEDETMLLKLTAFLLYRYDGIFSPNLFSFRQNSGAKKALFSLTDNAEIDSLASYKIDISDYFNSIDIPILLTILKDVLSDDKPLYNMLSGILLNERVRFGDRIITEKKGVMAGTPISSFLANLYLMELDEYFYKRGVVYARYSDDIILFDRPENIEEHIAVLEGFLQKYKLKINEKKVVRSAPHEEWCFLGFKYKDGVTDIADAAERKIKGKIHRQARKLRRWMLAKEAKYERALWAMNKKFNRKFYTRLSDDELCWSLWYFPIINTDEALRRIDRYMQENLRYIATGKYNKANYDKIPYEKLKECGYKPLVSAYYEFIKERNV